MEFDEWWRKEIVPGREEREAYWRPWARMAWQAAIENGDKRISELEKELEYANYGNREATHRIKELERILDAICGTLCVEHYGSAKAAIGALQQENAWLRGES